MYLKLIYEKKLKNSFSNILFCNVNLKKHHFLCLVCFLGGPKVNSKPCHFSYFLFFVIKSLKKIVETRARRLSPRTGLYFFLKLWKVSILGPCRHYSKFIEVQRCDVEVRNTVPYFDTFTFKFFWQPCHSKTMLLV